MNIAAVRAQAFAMPLTSPAFPVGPYRFTNREYFIVSYRTDPDKLRAVVPEPLQLTDPVVHYEFIRMPDSTGFGDYTESGQVIPVSLDGVAGNYTHAMYLNDHPPIAGGRELWGFPKKLASPSLKVHTDTLIGELDYGPVRIATATMGYKHQTLDAETARRGLADTPNFLLKIIPTWMARRASANWCATTCRTWQSKAPGPGRRRCRCSPMRWRRSRTCRCSKCSAHATSWPT